VNTLSSDLITFAVERSEALKCAGRVIQTLCTPDRRRDWDKILSSLALVKYEDRQALIIQWGIPQSHLASLTFEEK
jgi:hypothetical protein